MGCTCSAPVPRIREHRYCTVHHPYDFFPFPGGWPFWPKVHLVMHIYIYIYLHLPNIGPCIHTRSLLYKIGLKDGTCACMVFLLIIGCWCSFGLLAWHVKIDSQVGSCKMLVKRPCGVATSFAWRILILQQNPTQRLTTQSKRSTTSPPAPTLRWLFTLFFFISLNCNTHTQLPRLLY